MEIGFCNKSEVVKEVAKKIENSSKRMALAYTNAVFEVISEQLLDGNGLSINGVCKIEPYIKKSCTCIDLSQKDANGKLLRNSDGSPITKVVPERYAIRFKLIPSFKEKIKSVSVK